MVRASSAVLKVLKTTGGKLWHKPWGVPSPSRAARKNAAAAEKVVAANRAALKSAAAWEAPLPRTAGAATTATAENARGA